MVKQITIYTSLAQVVECITPTLMVEFPPTVILDSIIAYDDTYHVVQYSLSGIPSSNPRCPGVGEYTSIVKDHKVYSGIVTRCENDFIQVRSGNSEITVDRPSITRSNIGRVKIQSTVPISRVSYRLSGVSSRVIGNLSTENGSLSLIGVISNDSGELLHGNVVVAAGDINQSYREYEQAAFRSVAVQDVGIGSGLGDLSSNVIFYNAGIQSLPQRANIQLERTTLLSTNRVYQATTEDRVASYGVQIRSKIRLPSMQINVYQQQQYLGTATIAETQAGEPVTLILGRGGQVTISSNVSNRQIGEAQTNQQEISIQSRVKNFEKTRITFELRQFIGNAAIINAQHKSCIWDRRENGFVVWTFIVEPQQEYLFECSLVVSN